jgi:hypothetical protein
MGNLIPVEGMEGYFRDSSTGAILNKNNLEFQSYIKNREKMGEERKRLDSLQTEVLSLKGDVTDIKNLLSDITSMLRPDYK